MLARWRLEPTCSGLPCSRLPCHLHAKLGRPRRRRLQKAGAAAAEAAEASAQRNLAAAQLRDAAAVGEVGRLDAALALPGVDVSAGDEFRWTALHHAAAGGHPECVNRLLRRGADPDARSVDGLAPLHVAAGGGREPSIAALRWLLGRTAASPSALRTQAQPELAISSQQGRGEVIRVLLDAAGRAAQQAAAGGITALHLAAAAGSLPALRALLDAGADPAAQLDAAYGGRTAAQVAEASGHSDAAELLRQAELAAAPPGQHAKNAVRGRARHGGLLG